MSRLYTKGRKKASEREKFKAGIDLMGKKLKEIMGEAVHSGGRDKFSDDAKSISELSAAVSPNP